jgi:ABC-2 type transport system ATP-binding protein
MMTDAAPIMTRKLSKSYGDVRALSNLTLTVNSGEIFGFLGPNGAGKTTTTRLMLGLMRPTSGSARIFGFDVQAEGPKARRLVSYQPASESVYESMRAGSYLKAFAQMSGLPVHRTDELVERLELDTSRRIKSLSTGNRQKVGIVRALQADVPLYLLDEPTRGLDPLIQQEFASILAEYRDDGRTVFLSTHILSEAERLCDRVGILREGNLVAIERVATLTESRVRRFCARFAGPLPNDADLEGATVVVRGAEEISFDVTGSVDHVVKNLARFQVIDLAIEEPSLEDIFLRFYDQRGDV